MKFAPMPRGKPAQILLFFPKTKSIVKKQKTERHNKSCASQASTRHSNTQEKREINKTTKR